MKYTIRIYPKSQFNADGRFVGTALETGYSDRNMAVDCLLALRKTLVGGMVSLTDDRGGNVYPTQRDLARNRPLPSKPAAGSPGPAALSALFPGGKR